MNDLVKELRQVHGWRSRQARREAERIKKLEAVLRSIEYLDLPQIRGLPRRVDIIEIVRKALEGNDD